MSNATLVDILSVHLPYEIDMLRATFDRLEAPVADGVLANALIESFCIHARSLQDFLCDEQGVPASVFTVGDTELLKDGAIPNSLRTKLNTQIAHLTLKRTDDPTKKIGPDDRRLLRDALLLGLREFESHLKSEFQEVWKYELPSQLSLDAGNTPPSATNQFAVYTTATPTEPAFLISANTVTLPPSFEHKPKGEK